MSAKNFMSYGDAESVFTGFANAIKDNKDVIAAMKDGTDLDSFGDVEVALLDKADTADLGTAAAKDSTNAVTAGSTDLVESGAVKDAIDAAVAGAYHHAGTKTCAELVAGLLVKANEGNVYNMTDSGTTTSDFMEGIGYPIKAGDNVGVAKVSDGVYKFDLLSGFVDTTNFVQKSQTAGLLKNDGTVNDEIEDDVDQLKSGLTNVDVALSVPENTGKNVLPLTLASLKARNTSGTWIDNVYTLGNVSCTVNTDSTGAVTSLQTTAASTGEKNFVLYVYVPLEKGSYILSSGFSETYNSKDTFLSVSGTVIARGNNTAPGQSFSIDSTTNAVFTFRVKANGDITASPMIRPAGTTSDFVPYIPSVNSRLQAVESGLDGVQSGLINYENQNDLNLKVPNRKNVLPMTVETIKAANTSGTWSGNVYSINGLTYTIEVDTNGKVSGITAYGNKTDTSATSRLFIATDLNASDYAGMLLNGCPNMGGENYGEIYVQTIGGSYSVIADDYGDTTGVVIRSTSESKVRVGITVGNSFNVDIANAVTFYPMIRPATITDPTYAPYIPSVESRIEAVESGIDDVQNDVTNVGNQITGVKAGYLSSSSGDTVYIPAKVYPRVLIVLNNQGTDGTNGRPVIVGILNMGMSGAYKFEQITNITDYALSFTYDNTTDPDNPRFAVKYIKVSDSTPQAYLRGFYLTADVRWAG